MHSPLPDTRALEAGIIEDELPSRLSRVQDNVRNLLRNSRLVSVHSSPLATVTNQPNLDNGPTTLPESLTRPASSRQPPQVVPSPTAESTTSTASPTPTTQRDEVSGADVPPSSYQDAVQQMAHQSTWFNTRAVAALNHPDLTDPSLAAHLQQQQKAASRQRHAWKRSRHGRKRSAAVELGSSQSLLCVLAALLLAATVATYIVLATTSSNVTPTFHILFILGIILATIVFAHSIIRLFLFSSRPQTARYAVVVPSSPPHKHRRRHRNQPHHHHHHHRTTPPITTSTAAFVPPTPIPVHMPSDDEAVRPDSREALPTTTVDLDPSREPREHRERNSWDKEVHTVPNPPPAYGRWRGSVRGNPDLLHWQVVPSPPPPPVAVAEALPSPRYEDVVAEGPEGEGVGVTRPPSYVTRESPARRRGREVEGAAAEGEGADLRARVDEAEPECEMVEVRRGVGLGM